MRFDQDIRIFVAGHNGLVGAEIVKQLKSFGYNSIITRSKSELDLRNQKETEKLFKLEKPEIVYLAAAKVGGILANDTYKADFIYDNLAIAMNVIHSSYKYGAKKLLNLGSSCIYPKFAEQPIHEDSLLTGLLEQTNEPYAIAKIAALKLCQYYNWQYKTNFISLMPTNLYGKNDNFNLEKSHVLPALIRKFILARAIQNYDFEFIKTDLNKYKIGFGLDEKIDFNDNDSILMALCEIGIELDSIKLWGTGAALREFLFIEDLADASIYFMDNYDAHEIGEFINIGTGSEITIKDLATSIKDIIGYNGKIKFDKTKPDGTPRKLLNVSAASKLGWTANTPLKKGIRLVIDNYLNNHSTSGV